MKYHIRKFLNKGGGLAAIEIELNSYSKGSISADVSITDCNRKVSLDFYMFGRMGRSAALHKIDTLIGALQGFREALFAAIEEMDEKS